MTPPLPDRIAAAIDSFRARCRMLDEADCYGSLDRASYDEQRKGVLDARDALVAAIAEVVAEREQYRAVVARQIEDKRRLLAERNEARAVIELVAGNLAAWSEKREEAPASAQEHMNEAMHALVRFRPDGDYSKAAIRLRSEMWNGVVYAERDAATKRADGLAAELDEARAKLAGGLGEVASEREKQRKKWGSDHDASHVQCELPRAAHGLLGAALGVGFGDSWGIANRNREYHDRVVIAAALLVAEVDRIAAAEQGGE